MLIDNPLNNGHATCMISVCGRMNWIAGDNCGKNFPRHTPCGIPERTEQGLLLVP